MDGGGSFEDYSDMELTVRTLAEEPGLRARIDDYHAKAWPNFVHEGNGTGGLWSRIYTDFAEFQFALVELTLFRLLAPELNALHPVGVDSPEECTDITAQVFQSLGILVLAPVTSALWAWLGRRGRDPNPLAKFAVGLMMVGGSFFLIVFGARFAGPDFKTPLLYLALAGQESDPHRKDVYIKLAGVERLY